ncbi:MAG: hypothetical protein WCH65_03350 [bacterium]
MAYKKYIVILPAFAKKNDKKIAFEKAKKISTTLSLLDYIIKS